ncbi:unnamed protein product [Linum tenue]|uniref:Major facilitator superfamily (MFS) profile domain-containing protein n=1 Tax=Linum tenue TaxID=586396 RepID=A0AAV0IMB3_9ROSI|nr:unnamed protein product [Linum tenue]
MKALFFVSFVASLAFFLVGYDTVLVVYMGWKLFGPNLDVAGYLLSLVPVVGEIFAVISALAGGVCADTFGRKFPLIVAGVSFFFGNLLKCSATSSFAVLIMGQAATGVGMGLSFSLCPVYIAELVPAPVRGLLTSATEVSFNMGILVGYTTYQMFEAFPPAVAQKLLFGVALFPSLLFTLGMAAMAESPVWLIVRRGRIDEAKTILQGSSRRSPAEVNHIVSHVHHEQAPVKIAWNKFLRPPLRRVFISLAGLHVLRQLSGIETMTVESLLLVVHQEKKLVEVAGVIIQLVLRVAFATLSSWQVDKVGRRFTLLVSLACTSGFLVMYGLPLFCLRYGIIKVSEHGNTDQERVARALSIFAVAGIMSSFHFGVGPVTWIYAGEVFDRYEVRAQGSSLGVVINRAADTIWWLCFYHIARWLGMGGASLLVFVVLIGGLVFCFIFITDKQGQILE